jgi:hypothetical protein
MITTNQVCSYFAIPTRLPQELNEVQADISLEVSAALETPPEDITRRFLESQPYTATALAQIASWLEQSGDSDGAAMVERFAYLFSRHEATTIICPPT